MATSIGEATIKLGFDSKSLTKSMNSVSASTSTWLTKLGSVAKVGGAVIGSAISVATTAVTALGKTSIQAYSEYEQLVGGVETLYGKSADQLMKYASQSYKTAQMSASKFMDTAIGFSASLVQSLGGDTQKAADLANQAIIDMSDNANKMGVDITRLQDAYRGFARQQFNMLDNLSLGYGGSRQEMQRLLADAEKISGIHYDIGNFADITQAIHVIQTQLGITGTSAEEAGRTIQGSINMTKAAFQDLITGLTDPNADLGKLMNNVATALAGDGTDSNRGLIGNLVPAAEQVLKGITTIVEKGVPAIVEELPGLLQRTLPDLAKAAVALVVAITDMLPELTPVIADGISVMMEELAPYIPQILGSLIKSIAVYLYESWGWMIQKWIEIFTPAFQWIRDRFVQVLEFIKGIFQPVIDFFRNLFVAAVAIIAPVIEGIYNNLIKPIGEGIGNLVEGIKSVIGGVVDWLKANVIGPIAGFFSGLWNGVKSGAEAVGGGIKQVFSTIGNIIKTPINGIIDGINNVIDKINSLTVPDWVPGIGGQHPNFGKIPKLAQGGIVSSATRAIIGESGREAVIPLERNTDNWAGLLARTLADEFEEQSIGSGLTVYMTNNINNNLDADEIGTRLMNSIRRAA